MTEPVLRQENDADLRPTTLVFGGSGFVGRATCLALASGGHIPVVADIVSPHDTWEFRCVDTSVRDEVESAVAEVRPTAVVNLAYLLADACESDVDKAFRVNVLGSQNVIETCFKFGVPRLVYASSIAVYGDQSAFGRREVTELDRGIPVRLYGWYKLLQEQVATEYFRRGLSCVGLRMSTVYGPGRRDGLSAAVNSLIFPNPSENEVFVPWGMGEEFDLIHVDDVAEAILVLVKAETLPWSVVNSGGEYADTQTLVARLHRIRPDLRVRVPEEPTTLAHCSRVDWSRLRGLIGHGRKSLSERQRVAVVHAK